MKIKLALIAAAIALTNVSSAWACGESLFHSGQGMRYHAFITRQPADILIYHPGLPNGSDANRQLIAGLEKAGHHITVVSDETTMTSTLMQHHFDVVIAGAKDMDAITQRLDKSAQEPALLAVVDAKAATDEHFAHTVRENDGVNQYLKSIEQSMHTRGS